MTEPRSTGERAPPTEVGKAFTVVVRLSDERDSRRCAPAARLESAAPRPRHRARRGYPGLIASGAAHRRPTGPRSILGLGFDIRFRQVVLADEAITLRWTVETSIWKPSLNGYVTRSIGEAHTPRGRVLTGLSSLLLRPLMPAP